MIASALMMLPLVLAVVLSGLALAQTEVARTKASGEKRRPF